MGDSASWIHQPEALPGVSCYICSRCQTAALWGDEPPGQRATAHPQWESGECSLCLPLTDVCALGYLSTEYCVMAYFNLFAHQCIVETERELCFIFVMVNDLLQWKTSLFQCALCNKCRKNDLTLTVTVPSLLDITKSQSHKSVGQTLMRIAA